MTEETINQPNVLFIVMDTARYGNVFSDNPLIMPHLRDIASEGVTFQNTFANAPWTVPSHGSMFTGQYPSDHESHAGTKHFDPDVPVLAELLQDAGYRTAAFSNNTWLSPEFGFDRGFDSFFVRWELFEGGVDLSAIAKAETYREQMNAAVNALTSREVPLTLINLLFAIYLRHQSSSYDSGARRTNNRLLNWLGATDDQPFFAFVNYVEPHLPYQPPPGYKEEFLPDGMNSERLESVNQDPWAYMTGEVHMDDEDFDALETLYNSELRYLDDRIYEVYAYLEECGKLDETVIIIVGDHGENFGEHGMMDHQYCLYDTLLHVPLVIRYPEMLQEGHRIDGLVELRDLYPTLLDVADIEQPDIDTPVSRHSLVNMANENSCREQIFAEYLAPQPSMEALERKVEGDLPDEVRMYDRALQSVRTERWKYVEGSDGYTALYELQTDPEEAEDVSDSNPDIVSTLQKLLISTVSPPADSKTNSSSNISVMTKRRLEELGYLQ